jgi:hypothetical protein
MDAGPGVEKHGYRGRTYSKRNDCCDSYVDERNIRDFGRADRAGGFGGWKRGVRGEPKLGEAGGDGGAEFGSAVARVSGSREGSCGTVERWRRSCGEEPAYEAARRSVQREAGWKRGVEGDIKWAVFTLQNNWGLMCLRAGL